MPGSAPAMHFVMHTGRQAQARILRRGGRGRDEATDLRTKRREGSVEEEPQSTPMAASSPPSVLAPFVPASDEEEDEEDGDEDITAPNYRITRTAARRRRSTPACARRRQWTTPYEAPSIKLLQQPRSQRAAAAVSDEVLQENARELEGVLQDFGVKGEITNVRPGPVVTLYELEPAPGTKSSRVIGLADDIARSMSAVAARVAVVPGRNAIGIELPNDRREIVMLRELLESPDFQDSRGAARACARQEYRRRVDHRRPLAHAASPDRRHHRLGQVGRHQHHDPVAALPALARPVQIHHDRSEDARAVGL